MARIFSAEFDQLREVLVTITEVDTAADLQNATVWVSVLPEAAQERTVVFLNRHSGALRAALFRAVRFRPIPKLHFRGDTTEARAAKIEELINRLPKPENDPAPPSSGG